MRPARLSKEQLERHLAAEPREVVALVLRLRRTVLDAAPGVAEAIRFHCLAYFRPGEAYGAIGGNVCMIEARRGSVALSFLHGARLPDPDGLLRGSAKAKRIVPIPSAAAAADPRVVALILAAWHLPP